MAVGRERQTGMVKASRGRPTLLNDPWIDRFCKNVKEGLPLAASAAQAGCHYRTWRFWMEIGMARICELGGIELLEAEGDPMKHEDIHIRLVCRSHQAESTAMKADLARIRKAGDHSWARDPKDPGGKAQFVPAQWASAAWRLERRFPELFGRQAAIAGSPGHEMDLDDIDRLLADDQGETLALEADRMLLGDGA